MNPIRFNKKEVEYILGLIISDDWATEDALMVCDSHDLPKLLADQKMCAAIRRKLKRAAL